MTLYVVLAGPNKSRSVHGYLALPPFTLAQVNFKISRFKITDSIIGLHRYYRVLISRLLTLNYVLLVPVVRSFYLTVSDDIAQQATQPFNLGIRRGNF